MLRYYNDISEERMEEKKEQLHKDHRSRLRNAMRKTGLIHLKTITFSSFSCFMRSRDAIRIRQHTGLFRIRVSFGSFLGFRRGIADSGRNWEIERRISRACPRNGQTLYARCAFRTTVYRKGKNRRISCSLVFGKAAADLMPSCA